MGQTIVIRGRLCQTWNGGRDDEDQLGVVAEDGEVHILAQMVHDLLGRDSCDVHMRFWLTEEPLPFDALRFIPRYDLKQRLRVRYWEHKHSAHGYEATEDYEPEEYLYTTEVLEIGNVDLVRALGERLGRYLHLEISVQE